MTNLHLLLRQKVKCVTAAQEELLLYGAVEIFTLLDKCVTNAVVLGASFIAGIPMLADYLKKLSLAFPFDLRRFYHLEQVTKVILLADPGLGALECNGAGPG